MLKSDVVSYFRTQGKTLTQIAQMLNLSLGTVSGWANVIPERNALKLERLTNGELKYDASLYEKPNSSRVAD